MMPFALYAALIVVVICAFLFPPLWFGRRGASENKDRRAANLAIFRDQLADLERERQEGTLSAADFDHARQELQRRLLEEASPGADAGGANVAVARSRKTALALVVLLPLAAALGYTLIGTPAALDPARTAPEQAQTGGVSAAQIDEMIARLAERLQSNPGDTKGWLMLARSYKALGRSGEAARAYEKAWPLVEKDPQLLSDYADLLATVSGGLEGRPEELVNKALALDPDNLYALWLSGTAAFNRGDYATAIQRWEHAQRQLPPNSEDSKMLTSSIEEARQKQGGGKTPLAAAPTASIRGHVELADALKNGVAPGDIVFIVVKEAGGPPMPLAAKRLSVAELPVDFSFSDADALMPARLLSSVKALQIDARVSRSGNPTPQAGDLVGSSGPVSMNGKDLRIVIDKALP